MADRPGVGVLVPPDLTILALREEVVALLARRRLPAIYPDTAYVKVGALAFYGPDRIDLFRRSAGYVDRILRGEKPGDLPLPRLTRARSSMAQPAALSPPS